ncbi:MAG TPA: hypothetical protein VD963_10945, partial [Phycisphaerales bacterium]|nr:hypothetical protein [Phycisphaerales bacterium]
MPNQDHSQGSTRRGPLRLSVRLIVVLLAAVPLVGLTAGALWADHSWRDAEETRRAAVAGSLARFLRDSAQTVLASRDPGPLRLLLSSLGAEYGVEEASVTLGNGVVIAHSTPALASRDPLPAEWEADRSKRVEPGTTVSEGRVTSTVEFNVEGGTGWVTVTMPTSTPMIAAGTLEGLGLIGLGCVALTLLLARVATGFLRPLQAIQSAMRELSAGEESPAVLAV